MFNRIAGLPVVLKAQYIALNMGAARELCRDAMTPIYRKIEVIAVVAH